MCPLLCCTAFVLLPAGPPDGQLPALAAANPETYTSFLDCCIRSPVIQPVDMLAAAEQLGHAVVVVLQSDAALAKPTVVAGLASAVTSLVKKAVQFTQAAGKQHQHWAGSRCCCSWCQ
jgi:hypothetical protein